MKALQSITLDGKAYIIVPKAEYLRLRKGAAAAPAGAVEALAHASDSIGANLRRAREAADLTQERLASLLGKSQAMVSGAESGRVRVSARYVAAVLDACGLAKDWPAPPKAATKPQPPARRARRTAS